MRVQDVHRRGGRCHFSPIDHRRLGVRHRSAVSCPPAGAARARGPDRVALPRRLASADGTRCAGDAPRGDARAPPRTARRLFSTLSRAAAERQPADPVVGHRAGRALPRARGIARAVGARRRIPPRHRIRCPRIVPFVVASRRLAGGGAGHPSSRLAQRSLAFTHRWMAPPLHRPGCGARGVDPVHPFPRAGAGRRLRRGVVDRVRRGALACGGE